MTLLLLGSGGNEYSLAQPVMVVTLSDHVQVCCRLSLPHVCDCIDYVPASLVHNVRIVSI